MSSPSPLADGSPFVGESSSQAISLLRKEFNARLEQLSIALQEAASQVLTDDSLALLQEDASTVQFVPDRVREIVAEIVVDDRERYITRILERLSSAEARAASHSTELSVTREQQGYRLQTSEKERSKLGVEINALRSEIASLSAQRDQLQGETGRLESLFAESRTSQDTLRALRSALLDSEREHRESVEVAVKKERERATVAEQRVHELSSELRTQRLEFQDREAKHKIRRDQIRSMERENKALREELSRIRSDIDRTISGQISGDKWRERSARDRATNEELRSRLRAAIDDASLFKQRLDTALRENSAYSEELQSLRLQFRQLTDHSAALERERGILQSEIHNKTTILARTEGELASARKENTRLSADFTESVEAQVAKRLEGYRSFLVQDLQVRGPALYTEEQHNELLSVKVALIEREHAEKLTREVETATTPLRNELSTLQAEKTALETANAEFSATLFRMATLLDCSSTELSVKASSLIKELNTSKHNIEELRELLRQTEIESSKLKSESAGHLEVRSSARRLEGRVQELSYALDDVTKDRDRLQTQLTELRSKADVVRTEELLQQVHSLQSELSARTTELQTIRSHHAELESERLHWHASRTELSEAKRSSAKHRVLAFKLREQVLELRKMLNTIRKWVAIELAATRDDLELQMAGLGNRIKQVSELNALEKRQLTERLTERHARQVKDVRQELLRTVQHESDRDIVRLKQENQLLQTRAALAENKLKDVESRYVQELETTRASARRELDNLTSQIDLLQTQRDRADTEDYAKSQLIASGIRQLSHELSQRQHELDSLQKTLVQ